jgi:alpha-amylase/alpha-mannosidase (GH57 family)
MSDDYQKTGSTIYLNIIWHQHQPLYLDPESDQLQGPWVRTHGTKDYYDMVAVLQNYPKIHCTVNLTSSLLYQLEEYYVARLKPFVDLRKKRINAKKYFAAFGGKTDPWIDLALKPTRSFTPHDLRFLLTNLWNAFGVSPLIMRRFPEYAALKEKFEREGKDGLGEQDLRDLKFWFFLANFDPDFLEKKTKLVTGVTVNLTDLVEQRADGTYWLRKQINEDDCNRIVVETYKILAAIIPIHKKMMFDVETQDGQVEVITTPYYHPILPLLYDSDLARLCQPNDPMPGRFQFPEDAEAHVAKAVSFFESKFGAPPTGMWPAEGAVAHDIAAVFGKNGIRWIATDEKILARSKPAGQPKYYPYVLSSGTGTEDSVVIVFRDTELSDKIGFVYKRWHAEEAADDFIRHVLSYAPQDGEPDRLLSVILDGENAWEWYEHDHDGKGFQHALYRKLSKLHDTKQVITATVSEYLDGNSSRGVRPHPVETLPKLQWLWPGSWINANFDTWIGGEEENRAWDYLLTARKDLEQSGLPRPDPKAKPPKHGTKKWYAHRAWESLYAAEGSDWFWWYGTDQSAPSGDKPFDQAFMTFIDNIYKCAAYAQGSVQRRSFKPIGTGRSLPQQVAHGAMAQSRSDLVTVVFQCDARGVEVPRSICITGNHELLGNWMPNRIAMHDNGSQGDAAPHDGIWSYEILVPVHTEIQYKFTNSGPEGEWNPGEEFPFMNRRINTGGRAGERIVLLDRFGVL